MIRGNSALGARRGLRAWMLAALAALPITAVLAATQYLYDDLGRLVLVANSDGSAAIYAHDENGNVLSINQWAASGPVIAAFSPMQGHAGTPVTIFGTGFSATPANNTVTIGGVAAAISASTTTTLLSAIPQGASTGPIGVTVDGVTATSAHNITVYKPIIASFSPSLVAPGGSVTVTGASLNLVSGGTSLSVGGTTVTVTSLSNNQAVFTAPNTTGGPIVVNTPYGQTTSAASLVIVPNAVGVANVVDHDPADPDGPSQALAINQPNKTALLSFQAAASSYYSVQLDALALTPSGGSIDYTVYGPTGTTFASGSVSTTAPSIHLPQTTATGRYLVAFNSGSETSVQITARVELNTVLTANGTTVPSSTTGPRQTKRFIFTATASDDLAFALTNLVITPNSPNYVRVNVLQPSNYVYWPGSPDCYTTSIPGCSFGIVNLQAGTHQLFVESQGASTMSFDLTLSTDISGTLSPGNSTTLNFDLPGRQAWLTFTATANQSMALQFSSLSLTPAGTGIGFTVYQGANPVMGATPVASNANLTASATVNLSYLPAGTYSVYVEPRNAATGSVQLTLANSTFGALTANGSTQHFSMPLPQQDAHFTFNANAGDDLGMALTNLVTTPNPPASAFLSIVRPNGSPLVYGENCSTSSVPGCSWNLLNLPETGTYRVIVGATGASTNSFSLTLSPHVLSTLTPGTPQNVTLDVPGEHALLTFTTTGPNETLYLSGVTTAPAGKAMTMLVYNPSGVPFMSPSTTSETTLTLSPLAAGTYSVVLAPQHASTATATITLAQQAGGALTPNSSTQSYATTVPQQHAYFNFSATAGDDVGVALTNLVITPSSPNYVRIWVVRPSGNAVVSGSYCYTTTSPGCSFILIDVPETGTYNVTIESMGPSTMTANVSLSAAVATALSLGEPLEVDLDAPGEFAWLPFAATSGQPLAINVESGGTTPPGKAVQLTLYDPSGAIVQQTTLGSAVNINLANPSSGTYRLLISPADASLLEATVALSRTFSVWNDSTVPSTTAQPDSSPVELGVKFKVDYGGYIKGIRFYKGAGNNGTHVGNLWTAAGTLLATATFTDETGTGWQQVDFATPVPVTANTTYVASYFAPQGHYAYTGYFFDYAGLDSGPIHMPHSGTIGGNGVYLYNAQSSFPTNSYAGANYWVDVVYEFVDEAPPSVDSTAPRSGTGVASTTADVTATFNEPIDAATVSGATFELRTPSDTLVSAIVSYDGTNTAVLNPDAPLAPTTSYTARLKGGATGIRDASGNALSADYTWTFTTATGPAYSVWADTVVPAIPSDPNANYYELGVKFRVDTAGYIAGIRFYKGAGNSGTHVGNLWTASGTLLGSATFTNETATGWQQVEFATPVTVTANTVYVASYHAPLGRFAFSNGLFATSGVDAGPIHLLQNGVSGPNGVYADSPTSAFPTSTYNASYYWVDLVFVPNP